MAYWRLYYHFVWTTQERRPFITPDIEASLYRWLYHEANEMYCPFFYIGGTVDHVHVLTAIRPTIALSAFVKQLKGSSSRFISLEFKRTFIWQKGYGVFSVSEDAVNDVKAYVLNQKAHHRDQLLVAGWEETHEWNLGPETDEFG
ncbi:MAG: IS200/IS605 family transposase [Caldilineaceae bacterium]|nr:IS200/IS605 family transposase [Caldilineaceae bacterium]